MSQPPPMAARQSCGHVGGVVLSVCGCWCQKEQRHTSRRRREPLPCTTQPSVCLSSCMFDSHTLSYECFLMYHHRLHLQFNSVIVRTAEYVVRHHWTHLRLTHRIECLAPPHLSHPSFFLLFWPHNATHPHNQSINQFTHKQVDSSPFVVTWSIRVKWMCWWRTTKETLHTSWAAARRSGDTSNPR